MVNNIIIKDTSNNPEVLEGDYQYTIYTYNKCVFEIVEGSDLEEISEALGRIIGDIVREDMSVTYTIEWETNENIE